MARTYLVLRPTDEVFNHPEHGTLRTCRRLFDPLIDQATTYASDAAAAETAICLGLGVEVIQRDGKTVYVLYQE